jgi:6-phosphogluconolactonase (cycloisomerase 2 family)
MNNGIARAVTYFVGVILVAAALMTITGIAMAGTGNTCVYANDDVFYEGGEGPNTVDGYLVAPTSQTYLSPVLTGGNGGGGSLMQNIVMNPTKSILYASDAKSRDIAAMKIDPVTCQLTLLGDYPLATSGGLGIGLAITPDGKNIYASGARSAEIDGLNILKDGSLTAVRQRITLTNKLSSIAVSPDGLTLIVGMPKTSGGGNELYSYAIDPSTGTLTQVSIINPHGYSGSISIDAQSKFVYVDQLYSGEVRVGLMEIGQGSTLTFVRVYNFTEVTGDYYFSAALLGATGKFLYLTNDGPTSVTTLQVDSVTGGLKYVTTTPDGTMGIDAPIGLATSKNGGFVFTANFSNDMGIFAASKDGSLTSLGVFPMFSNGWEEWLAAKSF